MGTGSFPGVESGRGVTLTSHPLLVPRSINRVSDTSTIPHLRMTSSCGISAVGRAMNSEGMCGLWVGGREVSQFYKFQGQLHLEV
jgi:hypothetical protein